MSEQFPEPETVPLSEVPIEWWWTEGTTYDLPTYGAEMLGDEF